MIKKAALASRIRTIAAQKGMAIADLEREAGYSPGMVSRWAAAGDEDFGALTKLTNVARGLGVTVDYLLDNEDGGKTGGVKSHINGGTEILLEVTAQNGLEWVKLEAADCEKVGLARLPGVESTSGRAFAEAWWIRYAGCKFVVAAFCDDIQDPEEIIEVALFYCVNTGLPIRRADEGSMTIKELYVELRAREALENMRKDMDGDD